MSTARTVYIVQADRASRDWYCYRDRAAAEQESKRLGLPLWQTTETLRLWSPHGFKYWDVARSESVLA